MGGPRTLLTLTGLAVFVALTGCARTPLGAGVPADGGFGDAGPPPPPDCRLWPLSPHFYAAGLVPFVGGVAVFGTECREGGCEAVVLLAKRFGDVRRVEFDPRGVRDTAVVPEGDALVLFDDRRVERMRIDGAGIRNRQRLAQFGDRSTTGASSLTSDATGAFATAGYVRDESLVEPTVWTFDPNGRPREVWSEALEADTFLDGVLALAGGALVAWGSTQASDPEPSGIFVPTDPVIVVLDQRVSVGRDAVGLGSFTGSVRMPGGALLLGLTTDFWEGRAVTLPVEAAGDVGAAVSLPEPFAGARAIYVGGQPNGDGLVLVGGDYAELGREAAVVVGIDRDGQVAWARRFPDRVRSTANFVAASPEGPLAVVVESTESCCYDVLSDETASLAWLNPDGTCAE